MGWHASMEDRREGRVTSRPVALILMATFSYVLAVAFGKGCLSHSEPGIASQRITRLNELRHRGAVATRESSHAPVAPREVLVLALSGGEGVCVGPFESSLRGRQPCGQIPVALH